jgi:hypothetical protein
VFALKQGQGVRRVHGWTFRRFTRADQDSRKGKCEEQVHGPPCQKLQVDSDLAGRLLATGVPAGSLHYIGEWYYGRNRSLKYLGPVRRGTGL